MNAIKIAALGLALLASACTPRAALTQQTPAPSQDAPVSVHAYTIFSSDDDDVHYYSTSPELPPSFTAEPPAFRAFTTEQPGTVPVYLFTARMNDAASTQIYYYATSDKTPENFLKSAAPAFYAFAAPESGTVPIYLRTWTASDGTQLYEYSTSKDEDSSVVAFHAYAPPKPRMRLVFLRPVEFQGDLDRRVFQKTLDHYSADFLACYESVLSGEVDELWGRANEVLLVSMIDIQGKVMMAAVERSPFDEKTEDCITATFKDIIFPHGRYDGPIKVKQQLLFLTEEP